jgi:hypothetical protein
MSHRNNHHQEYNLHSRLKIGIRRLLQETISDQFDPWWLVSYHYKANKISENEVILDVGDTKRKLSRIIYQNRDKSIVGAGKFQPPKMLFFNERSRWGTDQFGSHMILERLPDSLNTQEAMTRLFRTILPSKVKSLSRWKRVDIQRVSTEPDDITRLCNYLTKQVDENFISLDGFNSDFRTNDYHLPTSVSANQDDLFITDSGYSTKSYSQ